MNSWRRKLLPLVLCLAALAGCDDGEVSTKAIDISSAASAAQGCADPGAGNSFLFILSTKYVAGEQGFISGTTSCSPSIVGEVTSNTVVWLIYYDLAGGFQDGGYRLTFNTTGTGNLSGSQVQFRQFDGAFANGDYCEWVTGTANITQNAASTGDTISGTYSHSGSGTPGGSGTCSSAPSGSFSVERVL